MKTIRLVKFKQELEEAVVKLKKLGTQQGDLEAVHIGLLLRLVNILLEG